MASSVLNSIADEVAETINAAVEDETISETLTAARVKRPRFELGVTDSLSVQVYPASIRKERIGRNDWQVDYGIGLAVVKAVTQDSQLTPSEIDGDDATESDDVDLLVEQLTGLFEASPVLADTDATLISVRYHSDASDPDAPYSGTVLSTEHIHAANVVMTFRGA